MSTELNNLISTLSEDNFRKLIQAYNREKYNTHDVRIIDGPYDGGNDLEILTGGKDIKKNIQITVQKAAFEKKLESDLVKASENISKFSYLNIMEFYISQNVSKDKRNELELAAEVNHNIKLEIIDGNALSQLADKYTSIRDIAYTSHKKEKHNSDVTSRQSKVLFDVLTHSNDTVEIKKNFITAYIYSYLFANSNSTHQNIYTYINETLNSSLDYDFLINLLQHLRSKKMLISGEDKNNYSLSDEKFQEIDTLYNVVSSDEALFITSIEDFIDSNELRVDKQILIEYLYKLYQDNYTIDIDEINQTTNSYDPAVKRTFNDLKRFFIKENIEETKASTFATHLLGICAENEFLGKLSTVYLFNNLYSSNKLEKYINSKQQELFIDTQILIRLLCVMSAEKHNFIDSALQSVKIFYTTLEKREDKVRLITSFDYIDEVSNHIIEAFKLQRFLELPFISKLGNSKNIFYNTFLELKNAKHLPFDFDFQLYMSGLLDIDEDELQVENFENLKRLLSKKVSTIFEYINFEIIYHPQYSNFHRVKQEYETILAYQHKVRSNTAIEHDVRTLIYLSTREYHTNHETGEYNEPFLITWDSFFYKIRQVLLDQSKEYGYWYIYSPIKLVDRLSIMNFNLNPQSINFNIIALTENNFNNSSKTVAFIDVLSSFFNVKDLSKISIIHKLANLESKARPVDQSDGVEEFKDRDDDNELTYLLLKLKNHYNSYDSKYTFTDLVSLFEIGKYEKEIIYTLDKALKDEKFIMFDDFDNLIKSNIEPSVD